MTRNGKSKSIYPRGASKKYLDQLWSQQVKARALLKCELCGSTQGLNAHHIHTRHNHSVRWYLPNGVCLCNECHQANKFSAHKNPLWFASEMRKLRGVEWEEELIQRTAKCFPWQKHLLEIKAYLKGEIDDYLCM